jgi:DNA polymerase III delta prime subunit
MRDEALKKRLREIYESQGLTVTDRILDEGIKALKESRFAYTPPAPSFATTMAKIWIRRKFFGPLFAIIVALIVIFVGWQVYRAGEAARIAEQIRIEITETLPKALAASADAARAAATDPDAIAEIDTLVAAGEAAQKAGDADAMRQAISNLDALRAQLVQTYQLRIVSRPGEDTGVFRIPDVNEDARNYYIIVEPVTPSGDVLSLPVVNQEDGQTHTVSKWGVRVPEATYNAIRDDKSDDGIVQDNILGEKPQGTLEVTYLMPVEPGAITEW